MKKILLITFVSLFSLNQLSAQCTFESLFPLSWGTSKYTINEHFNSSPVFQRANDTIRGSVFEHGLDYLFTARNMDLYFYSYTNKVPHPCFKLGDIVLNCIANDSGVVAYNYQVTFPASRHAEYLAVVDSLRAMMQKKFTYTSSVKNTTKATAPDGSILTGEGVCFYFNNEPIIHTNLTYPQFVVRGGFLAKKPAPAGSGNVIMNQAEEIQYYRIEILYKRPTFR